MRDLTENPREPGRWNPPMPLTNPRSGAIMVLLGYLSDKPLISTNTLWLSA
jgi:hypothetical protein